MNPLTTPVLFLIFNRPDNTTQVFEAIRKVKPEKLYIAADGPRADIANDLISCAQTREIINLIDWPCEVYKLFRDKNLGSRYAITTAIDWFFENEEEGIILEDDCLPGTDFFQFCADLLVYHRNDIRIMHIGGTNLQFGRKRGNASYYFSAIPSVWGWASWRRVWQLYDSEMTKFPKFEEENQMINVFPDPKTAHWVSSMARMVYEKKVLTWDYPLAFTIGIHNGLCITPNVNLVTNIGFGSQSTHTKDSSHAHAHIPTEEINVISHPQFLMVDRSADQYQLSLSIDDVKSWEVNGKKKKTKSNLFDKVKERLLPDRS